MISETIYNDLLITLKDKPRRLKHIIAVRDTALEFGRKYNLNLEILEIAALLHDITKYYSLKENKEIITNNFEEADQIFKYYNENTLHAFSAYVLAKEKYNIDNVEILNSILNHTLGRPEMTIYEKVIFISDYIEPNRSYESCVKVRKIVIDNLDKAVFTAIDDSIKHYEARAGLIPPIAYEARHFYKKLLEVQDD